MKTEKRLIGDFGERMAARFLRRHGYRIVARNYRAGHLELDIVAKNRSEIVFVEVKTRSVVSLDDDMPYGPPSAAVNRAKKQNTVDAAYAYLRENPSKLSPRIDVIEVYLDKGSKKPKVLKINHFTDAVTGRDI